MFLHSRIRNARERHHLRYAIILPKRKQDSWHKLEMPIKATALKWHISCWLTFLWPGQVLWPSLMAEIQESIVPPQVSTESCVAIVGIIENIQYCLPPFNEVSHWMNKTGIIMFQQYNKILQNIFQYIKSIAWPKKLKIYWGLIWLSKNSLSFSLSWVKCDGLSLF